MTLSETKEELSAVARSHGWSLEGVGLHELVPPEESLKTESQYAIFHPSEVEPGETTRAAIEEVERIQPRRVVFDSLSEMRLLARDPLRYRRQILALKQFFAGRKSTVLLLDDRTSADADLQVQSIAHGVLMLEQMELDYGAERRRLRVSKLSGATSSATRPRPSLTGIRTPAPKPESVRWSWWRILGITAKLRRRPFRRPSPCSRKCRKEKVAGGDLNSRPWGYESSSPPPRLPRRTTFSQQLPRTVADGLRIYTRPLRGDSC